MYYNNKDHTNYITAATAEPSTTRIKKKCSKFLYRDQLTYGTRRMAAMLTRILGKPANRKRIQRIFRKMGYITPSKSKIEILRSKIPNVKATDR